MTTDGARIRPGTDEEAAPLPQLRAAIARVPRGTPVPAPVAPVVGPVRRTFAPSHVVTVPTCAECGAAPAHVLKDWPPHYATIERDGRRFSACERCWRRDRETVPEPPPQIAARREAIAFDDLVLATLGRMGPATIAQIVAAQLGDGIDIGRTGPGRDAYVQVRDSVYRLEDEGEVRRLRSRGRRRVRFRVVLT